MQLQTVETKQNNLALGVTNARAKEKERELKHRQERVESLNHETETFKLGALKT